ncbi:MAG: oxaloacetate decarboxylase subunit alpha [Phycisphaerales bacterium]
MSRKINFIDCSLRDGHQSLLATRMSTAQCMRVLPYLKDSGYRILELWGGATLDAALRFTGDNPFDRLDQFRKCLGKGFTSGGIAIRSLCRGQNLFGYNPYPDNVVIEFLKEAVRSGNDRVRIFDALNDPRNLITAVMATKTFNGHAEAALSYTTSPVHDIAHFLRFAEKAIDSGADSLAIKDMAGLLHPSDCFTLVDAIKKRWPNVELSLHSHCTNGLANVTYIAGMIAGVDHIDTDYGPMAGGTAQPPVELMSFFAKALGLPCDISLQHAPKIDAELRQIRKELHDCDASPNKFGNPWPAEPTAEMRKQIDEVVKLVQSRDRAKINQAVAIVEDKIMVGQGYPATDRTQLDAQVPGGMISNLHKQLKDQGKLDLLPQILEEVPKVRADAGYIPLVTPTSQIVGTQASFNIITGKRYGMLTNEFKNLVLGKYGRTPGSPNIEVVKLCSPDGKTFSDRPAAYAPKTDLEAIYKEHGSAIQSNRDLLLILLFAAPARAFLDKRNKPAA